MADALRRVCEPRGVQVDEIGGQCPFSGSNAEPHRSRTKVTKCSWRKGWDSNPRMLAHRRFSRPLQSTTLPPFRCQGPLPSVPFGMCEAVWRYCRLRRRLRRCCALPPAQDRCLKPLGHSSSAAFPGDGSMACEASVTDDPCVARDEAGSGIYPIVAPWADKGWRCGSGCLRRRLPPLR